MKIKHDRLLRMVQYSWNVGMVFDCIMEMVSFKHP